MIEKDFEGMSEDAVKGLKISSAILEEFHDKNVPLSIGLAAITDCFLRAYLAAEVPYSDFLRICSSMIDIIQTEEEIRRSSKK